MWYREILAARTIVDPKGERTIHQTGRMYEEPTFIFGDSDFSGSAMGVGTGSQAFGPGHYTSQNPHVTKGYAETLPESRKERLPKGTNIINSNNLLPEEVVKIIQAWNEKYGTKFNPQLFLDIEERIDETDTQLFTSVKRTLGQNLYTMSKFLSDPEYIKLNPLLVELGFDAVEYTPYDIFSIPQHLIPKRKQGESNEDYDKRYDEVRDEIKKKKNILVINRTILTKPRLFQKVRLRPETVTPEEMREYKDEIQTTGIEYYKQLVESGAEIKINIEQAPKLLEAGMDPSKLMARIDLLDFSSLPFENKIPVFEKIYKYYNSELLPKIFKANEIYENKKYFQKIYGVTNDKTNEIGKAVNEFLRYIVPHERWLKRFFVFSHNGNGWDNSIDIYKFKPNTTLIDAITALVTQPEHNVSISKINYGTENISKKIMLLIDDASGKELAYIIANFKNLYDIAPYIYNLINIRLEREFPDISSSLNQSLIDNSQQSQPIQPEPKVAYKILQKTAGKTKYYYFNGESKPLRDHLEDIFPYANSVDIFYMMGRLRNKAMSDDQVANLLYEAAMGRLFPRFEDKRDVV